MVAPYEGGSNPPSPVDPRMAEIERTTITTCYCLMNGLNDNENFSDVETTAAYYRDL